MATVFSGESSSCNLSSSFLFQVSFLNFFFWSLEDGGKRIGEKKN
jgi:hypothetical protein